MTSVKTETIKIRIEASQRNLLDKAANLCGKSRSAFVLDAARQAAEETLLDQSVFALNDEQWEAFNEALNSPPEKNEALAKTLRLKTPW